MAKVIGRHTLETANQSLKNKGLDLFLTVIKLSDINITLLDKDYGEYKADMKALSPKSPVPLHKNRRNYIRFEEFKKKYIGKMIKGLKIVDVLNAKEHGYKSRGFLVEYIEKCGHTGISSIAHITNHRETFICKLCSGIKHGTRKKDKNGIRLKRTPTYSFWVANNKKLPEKYQEFLTFYNEVGEKPYKKAELVLVNEKYCWSNLGIVEDDETNLIAMAIRQAFRNSIIFKNALELVRVEDGKTTKYRCAHCSGLFTLKNIQVDHIEPIEKVNGEPLQKHELIERIWTEKIQILDKKCHTAKSTIENRERRANKKLIAMKKKLDIKSE